MSVDELREAKLNSNKECRELEERNRLLKIELESADRVKMEKIGREEKVLQLESELDKTRIEALTNEKRLKGNTQFRNELLIRMIVLSDHFWLIHVVCTEV